MSWETIDGTSSKCLGIDSSWESSPLNASVGRSSKAVFKASYSSAAQQTLHVPTVCPWPPAFRYSETLIASKRPSEVAIGYVIGGALMFVSGLVEIALGVDADGKSLEEIAAPLSAANH